MKFKLFFFNIFIFSIWFSTFILIPFFIISSFDNLDKFSNNNSNVQKFVNSSSKDSLDILFIGNSYCSAGVDSELLDSLELKIFNFGIATSGVIFYDLIVKDFLLGVNKKPKYIFILLSPTTFSSKSDFFSTYPVNRYLNEPINNFSLLLNYPIRNYAQLLKTSFKKGIKNLINSKAENNQVPLNIGLKRNINKNKKMYEVFRDDKFDEGKLNQLKKTIFYLNSKNINVCFFQIPTNELTYYFNDSYLKKYNLLVDSLKKDFCTIIIESEGFDQSYFTDIDHLNRKGAKKVTQSIYEKIKEKGILNLD